MANNIERSGMAGKFSISEVRKLCAETKARRAIPGELEREARERREAAAKAKKRGTRFPELATRGGTRPIVIEHPRNEAARRRLDLLDR